MITVITGPTGSGKTFLMSRLALKRRKQGEIIYPNFKLNFPNNNEGVKRWHVLSETYKLSKGVVCIDEGQKLFDARAWKFLPVSFADKIASHRHQFLDIYTTTQDLGHIDIRIRSNIHEIYECQSLFRYPKNERKKPILQVIKIVKKKRNFDNSVIKFDKSYTTRKYISKFWTKDLYNTYSNINLSHFLCQIKRDKKKWLITLQSRQLIQKR